MNTEDDLHFKMRNQDRLEREQHTCTQLRHKKSSGGLHSNEPKDESIWARRYNRSPPTLSRHGLWESDETEAKISAA